MSVRAQGIVRAVRAVEGSDCSRWLGMAKDGPPMRCSPIDSEQTLFAVWLAACPKCRLPGMSNFPKAEQDRVMTTREISQIRRS